MDEYRKFVQELVNEIKELGYETVSYSPNIVDIMLDATTIKVRLYFQTSCVTVYDLDRLPGAWDKGLRPTWMSPNGPTSDRDHYVFEYADPEFPRNFYKRVAT